jgi:hypothetical protein
MGKDISLFSELDSSPNIILQCPFRLLKFDIYFMIARAAKNHLLKLFMVTTAKELII